MVDHEALRTEALRIHARYAIELVEGLGFCPWAQKAREQGRVSTRVLLEQESALEQVVEQVSALERDPGCDIGLLLFPQLELGRIAFQHFAAAVRTRYDACSRADARFAIADFHPDAAPRLDSPAELVPFIRRSPDPTLQLVRLSAIAEVRLGDAPGTRFIEPGAWLHGLAAETPVPPLHERLASANLRQVQALGVEHVLGLFAAIELDRDRSYARLGLAQPPWRATFAIT